MDSQTKAAGGEQSQGPRRLMAGSPSMPDRRRIYLMRHAAVAYFDAEGRPLDPRHVPLAAAGREQAGAAAALLAEVVFDFALCSGLPRTLETARLVLGDRPLAVEEEARFKEVRAGRLAAVPAAEREQVIAYAYEHAEVPGAAFIGGERWADFQARVLAAWTELMARLVAEAGWRNLLVVAHDAVNRVLLAHVAGAGLAGLQAFEQDPACINLVEVDVESGGVRRAFLRAVNLAPYDPARIHDRLTVMEKIHRAYGAE
jgi:broad specificity phosphatase PhoE